MFKKKKAKRQIKFAYDAHYFLRNHPAFRIGFMDREGRENSHHFFQHAIDVNLDIHYARVDETGYVNDDRTKNLYTEVWLEFGPIEWQRQSTSHMYDNEHFKDDFTTVSHSHDYRLDAGAPTFDEALVNVANLVLKHYGDYEDDDDGYKICGGKCDELKRLRTRTRHLGLDDDADDTESTPVE